ncbi:ER membrane protein complex subunit 2-like [Paramacrobiotus metropolitanus]|uniref:ER membrane protein complex subunit 2-like n=1 Tax=Paramacrobiotus metropolitanus TaxID=2943436 RepID=UPI002445A737|nr:ER membrane protein complex subunit 2-like [Paramacrobiotus metropolitanus]
MASWHEARDRLKKIKEERLRRSEEVVELWENVLGEKAKNLGDEVWAVYEQVCIAALDCDRLDIAKNCVKSLSARFPTSNRVRRLLAMTLEADGKFDEAEHMYESLIERDETDTLSRKRLVAILKAQKLYADAIVHLNEYLKTFQNDQEAWLELVELYCTEQDYIKAAFCMEEVLIHHPQSHLHHQRYAEIRYALGGFENIDTARSHFAKAVKLCPTNVDALFGMCMCASFLAMSNKSTALKRKDNQRYAEWAAHQLQENFPEKLTVDAKSKLKNITISLDSLQL